MHVQNKSVSIRVLRGKTVKVKVNVKVLGFQVSGFWFQVSGDSEFTVKAKVKAKLELENLHIFNRLLANLKINGYICSNYAD